MKEIGHMQIRCMCPLIHKMKGVVLVKQISKDALDIILKMQQNGLMEQMEFH